MASTLTVGDLATKIDGIATQVASMRSDATAKDSDRDKIVSEALKELEKLKDHDVKAIREEIEKIQTAQKEQFEAFRRGVEKSPNHIPGLTDASKDFSVARAIAGTMTGKWDEIGAGLEKEAMDNHRQKSTTTNTGAGGAYFIPDEAILDIIFGMFQKSAFVAINGTGETVVSVINGLQGSPVRIPKFDGGCIAYWIGSEDEYAESAATVGQIQMTPRKIGVLTKIPVEVMKFTSYGYENLLRQDMIRALARKIDKSIAYGLGNTNEPTGIVNSIDTANLGIITAETYDQDKAKPDSVLVYSAQDKAPWDGSDVASAAGGELDFDDIDEMRGMLEDLDVDTSDFRTIAHPRTFRRLRQLKISNFDSQAADRPYILGMPIITDDKLEAAIGPFSRSTQIRSKQLPGASLDGWSSSAAAKFGDVFCGVFREIMFGRWGGIEIDDDTGRGKGFTSDLIYAKLRMYCDIQYRHPASIVVCPDAKTRN